MEKIIIATCLVMAISCKSSKPTTRIFINSFTVDCVGVAPMKCMQIKTEKEAKWESFYGAIEGFTYAPGYLYELELSKISLPKSEIPADGSSFQYSLIKVHSKTVDKSLRLNDLWVIDKIDKVPFPEDNILMEIQVTRNQLILHSLCNVIRGKITNLGDATIQFEQLVSTRKMCPKMATENRIKSNLSQVRTYEIKNNTLLLFDENDMEILTLKKTD
jgi:heat shock protein HslJ